MTSNRRPGIVQRNLYWIAILPLALVPLGAWLFVSQDDEAHGAIMWAGFALFLAGLAASCAAMGSRYRRATHQPEAELDERELALRYRARTIAFQIYWLITLLGCLYLLYAPRIHAPVPTGNGWFWVLMTLSNLFALLPIVVLEWSSDPLSPEEEE